VGFWGCDARPFNPLLATLPRTLLVRREQLETSATATASRGAVLSSLIQLALAESKLRRSGSECVLSRVSELLFVEAIRLYVEALPAEQSGWLAGMRDPHVGKALARLHDRPARAWSLEELASEVGTFALTFGRALRSLRRAATDAVPREVADAARLGATAEHERQPGSNRRVRRLRLGVCLQSCLQAPSGRSAGQLSRGSFASALS
jgi:hypothetical protein